MFKRGYLMMWISTGAIGGAIGLFAVSMITGREFPTVTYLGFIVGWSIGVIGLFRAGKRFG
ncbi:hypothetical protein [Thermococcus waiotapuensis]|uniref:Uncharacterized protein n=1 Tax=Thermococcus waiotapuensis TaxID=90909 RepID=A0AAE4NUM0_9EURY|nr:hypothetical protein [Thermococcus waiotapuensis]MDV3104668.1 hypothetical protein [Thermococcus waiotapuensis]